ncbi:MAG: hypothetical protein KDK65_03710 [Chlamydiia bacterium]|nr:hypothetical protein [Chlamydiia bacterium]
MRFEPLSEKEILLWDAEITVKALQLDPDDPVAVIHDLAQAILALDQGGMVPIGEPGYNSTFFLRDTNGNVLWVFKPEDGESAVCEGIQVGGGARREHVASLLNYHHRYPIPFTAYVSLNGRVGSVQRFQNGCQTLSEIRDQIPGARHKVQLPLKALQGLTLFDLRFGNCDRNSANILCHKSMSNDLVMDQLFGIDHGSSMSSLASDPLLMDYLNIASVFLAPMDHDLVTFIRAIDVEKDGKIMLDHGIGEEAVKLMKQSTALLQAAVALSERSRNMGRATLSLAEIAHIIRWSRLHEGENIVEDYLMLKDQINDMKNKGMLSAQNVYAMRRKRAFDKKNLRIDPFLFETLINNYCKCLTDRQILLYD